MTRDLDYSPRFKKDFARIQKSQYAHIFVANAEFDQMLDLLKTNQLLPQKNRDHKLKGEWIGCRACHIKPDLVLIYEQTKDGILALYRLGTHSEVY